MFDQLVGFSTKTIIPLAIMASESIAHSAFGLIVKQQLADFCNNHLVNQSPLQQAVLPAFLLNSKYKVFSRGSASKGNLLRIC